MSEIYSIADKYVDEIAALHPPIATYLGVPGYDHLLADYSPDGAAERAEHSRKTLERINAATIEDERDRIARDVMAEELEEGRALFQSRVTGELYARNFYDRAVIDILVRSKAHIDSKMW